MSHNLLGLFLLMAFLSTSMLTAKPIEKPESESDDPPSVFTRVPSPFKLQPGRIQRSHLTETENKLQRQYLNNFLIKRLEKVLIRRVEERIGVQIDKPQVITERLFQFIFQKFIIPTLLQQQIDVPLLEWRLDRRRLKEPKWL